MPAGDVEVEVVDNRRTHLAFRELPYRLYQGHPHWVPPLRGEEDDRWSADRNASLASRWTRRFLARRGSRVVGRIAVITDPAFQARWETRSGFFGFLECPHDHEVARALFARAEAALLEHGADSVLGPVALSTNDEVGLLVDGFDEPPTLLTSYHPPFYAELVEAAGYKKKVDYDAFRWDPQGREAPAIDRIVRSVRAPLRVRSVRADRWEAENRTLFELYNRSFEGLWGFVPLHWDEYWERAQRFRPFYERELVVIAEWASRPVGFAVALPDIHVALARAGGRLWPLGWWRLWRSAARIRTARCLLLGVLPEYTGRGVAALLAHQLAAAGRRLGLRSAELSLVQSTNRRIQHVITAFGGQRSKTYRLYEKSIRS